MCVTGVYNSDEFPTTVAFGNTLAAAAAGEIFFAPCARSSPAFAVKSLGPQSSQRFRKVHEEKLP
jgi:hypothetical protein